MTKRKISEKQKGRLVYSCSTPSTSSSVAAPQLHLQQQLHQKQSIPGEDHSRNHNRKTKKKGGKKPREKPEGRTEKKLRGMNKQKSGEKPEMMKKRE
jgi:hypothetical protein